jgi:hypothetical protein
MYRSYNKGGKMIKGFIALVSAWLLLGWTIMMLIGVVHAEVLPFAHPVGYPIGLVFSGILLVNAAFAGIVAAVAGRE